MHNTIFELIRKNKKEAFEEGLFLDRKEEIHKYKELDKQAELIRDVISFANVAYVTGRRCYLVFGIDDAGSNFVGIQDVPPEAGNANSYWERHKHDIKNILEEYIEPSVSFSFEHETHEYESASKSFAYLELKPDFADKAFHVKKGLRQVKKDFNQESKTLLEVGQSWIRSGESKKPLMLRDPQRLTLFEISPKLFAGQLRKYCQKAHDDLDIAIAKHDAGYQPLQTQDRLEIGEVLTEFTTSDKRICIVEGFAGSGKTLAVQKWCAKHLQDLVVKFTGTEDDILLLAQDEIVVTSDEFAMPSMSKVSMPSNVILYETLRGWTPSPNDDLASRLAYKVNVKGNFWKKQPRELWRLFEHRSVFWTVVLDGFDEASSENWGSLIDQIRSFVDKCGQVRVILTSRPLNIDWEERFNGVGCSVRSIAPLSIKQIENIISQQGAVQSDAVKEALLLVKENPGVKAILERPLYLITAMQELVPSMNGDPEVDQQISDDANVQVKPVPAIELVLPTEPNQKNDGVAESDFDLPEVFLSVDVEQDLLTEPLEKTTEQDVLTEPLQNSTKFVESNPSLDKSDEETTLVKISLAKLLDLTYTALFDRERGRYLGKRLDYEDWWNGSEKLSWHTNGWRGQFFQEEAKNCLGSNQGVDSLLYMGVLVENMSNQHRLMYEFYVDLVWHYFAAAYLRTCADKDQAREINELLRKVPEEFRDKVVSLARDLISNPTILNDPPVVGTNEGRPIWHKIQKTLKKLLQTLMPPS